jgi:hypothetical protein
MSKFRLFSCIFVLLSIAGVTSAAVTTIPDDVLAESAGAQTGVGTHVTLDASFDVENSPVTISGTLDPSPTSNIGPGAYNLGMTIGNVYFLLHPYYASTPGAFRPDYVNLISSLVTPSGYGIGNISMGFIPDESPLYFLIVLTRNGPSIINSNVTISQGSNSFNQSFDFHESVFGSGGLVSSFGVFHNGAGPGFGVLGYSNVMAELDTDSDTFLDSVDNCPNDYNLDQADLNDNGIGDVCEIAQLCPTDGDWKNHGKYVSCVTHAAKDLRKVGAISRSEIGEIVSAAAQSEVGK